MCPENSTSAERKPAMQAHYTDQTLAAPAHTEAEEHTTNHFLYQGVTVVAILLFLISFWSC
jgi:hypothetical protein